MQYWKLKLVERWESQCQCPLLAVGSQGEVAEGGPMPWEHWEICCAYDLFGLRKHKKHVGPTCCDQPEHNPVMHNQNIMCRVLKGFSRFGDCGLFSCSFCPFACESQGQIEICWLQHLEDASKDPAPGSEFPNPAGNQNICPEEHWIPRER